MNANQQLTKGYVLRHIPPNSGLSLGIALLDIAQDHLLAHLSATGIFGDLVIFKGGTALRKLFAGRQGRFSTDIDLAMAETRANRDDLAELIAGESRAAPGPFQFDPSFQRGRWEIRVSSEFGNPPVTIKLDVGPPCWLAPVTRPFVEHPTHRRYGFELPALPCMPLEEILAEKIARLTRQATARDAYDLVWAATTSPHSQFAPEVVRRLAALKVWVDNHGLRPEWSKALAPVPLEPAGWLASKGTWDDEQIGLLAGPPPKMVDLERDLQRLYAWIADLTQEEARFAQANPNDRGDVIRAILNLPGVRLTEDDLW